MPSALAHFVAGAAVAFPFTASEGLKETVRPAPLVVAAGLLAVSPDLDTLFYGVIPTHQFFGHRGFFHSPFFIVLVALALSSLVASLSRRFKATDWLMLFFIFALAGVTHPLVDALSNSHLGVMLLYPWTSERFLLPWQTFNAPPIRIRRLSLAMIKGIVGSELWFVLACCAVSAFLRLAVQRWNGLRGSE